MSWKVGDPWTWERRVKQGKYYWKIGKKHSAYKQWGKAGAQAKKEKGIYWEITFDYRPEYETPGKEKKK